jgi:hypothetical protein
MADIAAGGKAVVTTDGPCGRDYLKEFKSFKIGVTHQQQKLEGWWRRAWHGPF